MSDLQTLIESIVTDVINARFQADVLTAELAQHYRQNDTLRQLSVPALNITNLSVELRVAFDDTPIEPATEPSPGQKTAIETGADALRTRLMGLSSVRSASVPARSRAGLSRSLNAAALNAATASVTRGTVERRRAIETAVNEVLAKNGISLGDEDRIALREELEKFDARVAAAPKPAATSVPGLIVGMDRLKELDPNVVSVVRFDIDLVESQWVEVEDADGGTTTVLREP